MKLGIALFLMLISLSSQAECVILLHGLWRSPSSLELIENDLTTSGYHVVNIGYPSRMAEVDTLAISAIKPALTSCPDNETVNFVTHSLGGILVREYLATHEIENLGRVVMLGPPNQGSEVVDLLGELTLFKLINGPAGSQLGTDRNGVIAQLGSVNFDLGIIAGDSSINFILSEMIPGPDDGKVSVVRTKIEGMTDHLVLPVNHATMMKNSDVRRQVLFFLQSGKFERSHEVGGQANTTS